MKYPTFLKKKLKDKKSQIHEIPKISVNPKPETKHFKILKFLNLLEVIKIQIPKIPRISKN